MDMLGGSKVLLKNILYNENSITGVKKIPDNYVHAIISDIPYGISYDDWDVLHSNSNSALGGQSEAQEKSSLFKRRGKPLNGWSEADKKIPLEYQRWVEEWAPSWFDVLKPGGSVFIFSGRRYAHRVIVAFEDAGFTFKDMIAWERDKAPHRAQRVSSVFERRGDLENMKQWTGWRMANLRPIFEPILWFQKPYPIGTTIADNLIGNGVGAWNEQALIDYNLNGEILNQSNLIKVSVSKYDRGLHNTQKPLALMKLLVELVTQEGQIVLDPFAGSGTTLLAAEILNRKYIGYEMNKDIFNIALDRLSTYNLSTNKIPK